MAQITTASDTPPSPPLLPLSCDWSLVANGCPGILFRRHLRDPPWGEEVGWLSAQARRILCAMAKYGAPKRSTPAAAAPPPAATSAPLPIPTLTANDAGDKAEADRLLTLLEAERNAPALIYWTGLMAKLHEGVVVSLYDQLRAIGKQPRLDLVLWTTGGDTDAPWPIITLLREFCDHLSILIPHRAQSAGTLLALGANEVVMTPLSVLGPTDPTRTHHLLPTKAGSPESEAVSVQDMRHAMEFVRTAFGKDTVYSSEAMATILSTLFDKVHPLAIGALEQSYALAKLIAKQCLSTHMDPVADAAKIEDIASRLCDEYKSHTYEIGRREARRLGLPVKDATNAEEGILLEIWKFYSARPLIPTPPPVAGQRFVTAIAWLESRAIHQRVAGIYEIDPAGSLKILQDSWTVY